MSETKALHVKVDIQSQNFDYYFARQAELIPMPDRELLPPGFNQVLYNSTGSVKLRHLRKFNLMERLFILWKAAKKNFYIVIYDESRGMSIEDFIQWTRQMRDNDTSREAADPLAESGHFILAGRQLAETFNYLNRVGHSPAMNYVTKLKEKMIHPQADFSRELRGLVMMLTAWESRKREWQNKFGINVPELYILMALYVKGEIKGSLIYKDIFRRAQMSSPSRIKECLLSSREKGLIIKGGITKNSTYRLTPLGADIVNKIIMTYTNAIL